MVVCDWLPVFRTGGFGDSDRAYAVSRDCDTKRQVVEDRRYEDGEIELIGRSSDKKRRFRSS